jgi:hypothetical protein
MRSFSQVNDSAAPVSRRGLAAFFSTIALASLAACGGGGGAAPAQSQGAGSGSDGSGGSGGGTVVSPILDTTSTDAFYFKAGAAYTDLAQFEAAAGGPVYSTWSPSGPANLASPGPKVLFFGTGAQCAAGTHDGAVVADGASAALTAAATFGVASNAAHSWIPSGNTAGCSAAVKNLSGRSTVVLAADPNVASSNALMVRTFSGPGDANGEAFLLPQPASGQDGKGLNANITNTTVAFRQTWPSGATRQPWAKTGEALIHAEQAVSSMNFPAGLAAGQVAQSKQQLMATFVNRSCWLDHTTYGHPCEVQVVLQTAIARTDGAAIPQSARIWFDRAQGGMLIVNGVIPAAGGSGVEGTTGAAIFHSYGAATQGAPFTRRAFDVGITMAQLQEILRIGTAQSLGVSRAALTDAQVAQTWGPTWNVASDWSLLVANATQEIFNNSGTENASIDGEWYSLYVGPKS